MDPSEQPAVNDLPIHLSYLVSALLESFFYGGYTVLAGICVWILIAKRGTRKLNVVGLITTFVLFALATVHIALQWTRTVEAFYIHGDEPDGPRHYLRRATLPLSLVSETVYGTLNVLQDLALVHRCWIVWQKNYWVIALPLSIIAFSGVCATMTLYYMFTGGPEATIFSPGIYLWATIYFSLAVFTNVTLTGLIAYRIYRASRQVRHILASDRGGSYHNTIAIIVESGALYIGFMFASTILYGMKFTAKLIPFQSLAPVMGIVPTLIIVRIGLGQAVEQQPTSGAFHSRTTGSTSGHLDKFTNPDEDKRSKIVVNVSRTEERYIMHELDRSQLDASTGLEGGGKDGASKSRASRDPETESDDAASDSLKISGTSVRGLAV